jgi:hypothetical protein
VPYSLQSLTQIMASSQWSFKGFEKMADSSNHWQLTPAGTEPVPSRPRHEKHGKASSTVPWPLLAF